MSTSLLAFLSLLEDRVRPLLTGGKTWRFLRLINFHAHEGVLQLWDGDDMAGQAELRESRRNDAPPAFTGSVRSAGETDAPKPFSFRALSDAEVERQAQLIAELWRQTLPEGPPAAE